MKAAYHKFDKAIGVPARTLASEALKVAVTGNLTEVMLGVWPDANPYYEALAQDTIKPLISCSAGRDADGHLQGIYS